MAAQTFPMTNEELDSKVEERMSQVHKLDSENILLYCLLLIATVITIWAFKHRRLRFIHETGLTLLYGMITGLLIKLLQSQDTPNSISVAPVVANYSTIHKPPDYVQLDFPLKDNSTQRFTYEYAHANKGKAFQDRATFDPEIFFNLILPPIIFHAGYSLKRRHFFRNIGTIAIFAVFGTTLSCLIVGVLMYGVQYAAGLDFEWTQCFYFGAVISATDPVTVLAIFNDLKVESNLYAIVFGEAALNDAVAIVLSRTIEGYLPSEGQEDAIFDFKAFLFAIWQFLAVFLGSFGLGALVGCICALTSKFINLREHSILETATFVLMSYISFLTAEVCGMTGIVAVLFCGICQAHYTYNNLSEESQVRTKQLFELLNFLAENFIFTYIGVSMFTSLAHKWDAAFIIGSFFAIFIGRALFVYPFSAVINCVRKPPIPAPHQHCLVFAGLRGAVAFALATVNTATPQRRIIYTTTSLIVITTVLFNGGMTLPIIQWLDIKHGDDDERTPQMSRSTSNSGEDGGEAATAQNRSYNPWDKAFLPRKWYNFDARFMKPLLTHSRPTLMETMPRFCQPLARLLTSTRQMVEGSQGYAEQRNERAVDTTVDVEGVSVGGMNHGVL